ncbi:unnamed protein product [Closterium sp. NIES-64]|nr:unnamed protein product [Closterium sp. NIES-64]
MQPRFRQNEDTPDFVQPRFRKNEVRGQKDKCGDQAHMVGQVGRHLYISALLEEGDEPSLNTTVSRGWPASVHIIGKDILRFHAFYGPAMLMSARLPQTTFLSSPSFPPHPFYSSYNSIQSPFTGHSALPRGLLAGHAHDNLQFHAPDPTTASSPRQVLALPCHPPTPWRELPSTAQLKDGHKMGKLLGNPIDPYELDGHNMGKSVHNTIDPDEPDGHKMGNGGRCGGEKEEGKRVAAECYGGEEEGGKGVTLGHLPTTAALLPIPPSLPPPPSPSLLRLRLWGGGGVEGVAVVNHCRLTLCLVSPLSRLLLR